MSNRIGKRIYSYIKTKGERAYYMLVHSAMNNKTVTMNSKHVGSKRISVLKQRHSAIS